MAPLLQLVYIFILTLQIKWNAAEVTQLSYEILEDLPQSSVIGNIGKDTGLSKTSGAYFEIHKQDSQCINCFRVESGLLKSDEVIDRDTVCPGAVNCVLNLEIVRKPVESLAYIQVKITVTDQNDHSPTFNPASYTLNVNEIARVGKLFSLPPANDPDSLKYGITGYQMSPNLPQFELVQTEENGEIKIALVLALKLDRENKDEYKTKIYCTDGGSKTGVLDLTIKVTDFNDNPPVFKNTTYYASVKENSEPPVTIGQVKAADADTGVNAKIKYTLAKSTEILYGSLFKIGEQTGTVNALQKLDREQVSRYELSVQAIDGGYEPLSGFTKIVVTVLDLNDNPPEITINNAVNNSIVSVQETNNTNTNVAHITIVDRDVGQNAKFSCDLDNDLFKLEPIFRSEYKLIATIPLDRETVPNYEVTLRCRDNGDVQLESQVAIEVNLLDVNDITPQFNQTIYYMSVKENTPKYIAIGQVFASDLDEGYNGHITYHLAPDAYDLLSIDTNSGVISTNYEFDYEKHNELSFHVVARDEGQTIQRSSSAQIRLTIIDANDEVPKFSQDIYQFSVKENQPQGIHIGDVIAADADSKPFNNFIYLIEQDITSTDNLFSINALNGSISANFPMNRETQPMYNLKVIAKDQAEPYGSSTSSVTIFVTDENDNAPVIDFPNSTHDTVYVSSRSNIGTILCKILARDIDDGVNAQLAYSMQTFETQVPFVVHPITGDVVLQSKVSRDQEYTVKVIVMDNGQVPLATEVPLTIKFNSSLTPPSTDAPRTTLENNNQKSLNQNMVIIIVLSVVFTVVILFLAVVLIVLKCKKTKHTTEGPYIVYEPSEQSPDPEDKVAVKELNRTISPVPADFQQSNRTARSPCRIQPVAPQQYNTQYAPSFTQVCHWLKTQPEVNSDADSACSLQLSTSDSGRGTEEGDANNSGLLRDSSMEEAHVHQPNKSKSEKHKTKKVCFSDNVTDINQSFHNRSMDSTHDNNRNYNSHKSLPAKGQNNLNKPNITPVPLGVIDTKRNKLLYGSENHNYITNKDPKPANVNITTQFVPPRPPRNNTSDIDARRQSVVSEDSEDGASTTSGSYVVDMGDFDDVGTATMV